MEESKIVMNIPEFKPHHLALSVVNLDTQIDFYTKFGFKVKTQVEVSQKNLEIAQLVLNNWMLELFCFQESHPNTVAEATKEQSVPEALWNELPHRGIRHFALQCANLEETLSWLQTWYFGKAVPKHIPEIVHGKTGIRYVFIRDPEGNLIELVEA